MPSVRPGRQINDGDNGQAGVTAPSGSGWTPITQVVATDVARLSRFTVNRAVAGVNVVFSVSGPATANDLCDVGIYGVNGTEVVRIASSGGTAGLLNSTGVKAVPVAVNLTPGSVYYAALAGGTVGGVGGTLVAASYANVNGARQYGTAAGYFEVDTAGTAYPLPGTIVPQNVSGVGFMLTVREF